MKRREKRKNSFIFFYYDHGQLDIMCAFFEMKFDINFVDEFQWN